MILKQNQQNNLADLTEMDHEGQATQIILKKKKMYTRKNGVGGHLLHVAPGRSGFPAAMHMLSLDTVF